MITSFNVPSGYVNSVRTFQAAANSIYHCVWFPENVFRASVLSAFTGQADPDGGGKGGLVKLFKLN